MKEDIVSALIASAMLVFFSCQDSKQLPPGYPDRLPDLDVLPGFRNPPPGYGQVPFWWWTIDTLNPARLEWQVRELHSKGISGVQVNYSHYDTSGGRADLIKGKVSSSIANLYQRPRVWLEGYHSLGWGATPELLMFATRENYLYGCTLLKLHGFGTQPEV